LAQVNGKQLKKLKKKKQASSSADTQPEQASVLEQKHQAQLAGAAEAVPLKLKQEKLAQRHLDTDLQNMNALLHPQQLSNGRPAKKQKKQSKNASAAVTATHKDVGTAENGAAMPNVHVASTSAQDGSATQKKRVCFAMKRNLLMQIGGAVPPEEIRTPPDSRPKVGRLLHFVDKISMAENEHVSASHVHFVVSSFRSLIALQCYS